MRRLILALIATGLATSSSVLIAKSEVPAPSNDVAVDEEIIVEGKRALVPRLRRGFEAFDAGEFKVAEQYFRGIRLSEFQRKADNFTDWLNMLSPGENTRMSGKHLDIRSSDPWRRQAYAILYYMEGMAQLAQGETKSARITLKKAIRMDPRHFDARADYALLLIQGSEPKKAEKHIERLDKLFRKCRDVPEGTCAAIEQRLWQVEVAYGKALSG